MLNTLFATQGFTSTLAERQGARAVSDVVVNDASVALVFPRQSYRDVFRIRGFNYFNYNMLFMGLPGMVPKQRVLPQNAERVEVFKGPDTFLNGVATGGAVGGSINLIPKRAGEIPVREVAPGFSSDGQPSAQLDLGGRFGADGELGIRGNATWRDGDLTVDNQSERLGSLAFGMDWRGDGLRLSADKLCRPRPTVWLYDWRTTVLAFRLRSSFKWDVRSRVVRKRRIAALPCSWSATPCAAWVENCIWRMRRKAAPSRSFASQ